MNGDPSPTLPVRSRGGCLFVLVTCTLTLLFFGINNSIVETVYAWLSPEGPDWFRHRNTAQFIMFAGPVLLLFVEWWLLEMIWQTLRSRRANR